MDPIANPPLPPRRARNHHIVTTSHRNALTAGYLLHWYRIESILGRGGFGITYLATDTNLDRPVAIKEYLPLELAVREGDHSVQPHSEQQQEFYRWGLERFVREAQTLARFEHPAIVRVHSVFEANNTAYMVMRYERGRTLQDLLADGRTLPAETLLEMLAPLLEGLALVHEQGFVHRDIKPANLFLRDEDGPLLIDFGSARQAFGHETRTLTAMVSPGYAPFEQYHGRADQQGPWSDIYGMGATLYRALLGKSPPEALLRSEGLLSGGKDPYVPAVTLGQGRLPAGLLGAIDHALAFKPEDRPRSVAQWRAELAGDEAATLVSPSRPDPGPTAALETTRPQQSPGDLSSDSADEVGDADYRAFIGPRKTDAYLQAFRQMDADRRWWRPRWHRSAALGGPLWLAWRRRYRWLLLHPVISAAFASLMLLPLALFAGDKPLPAALVATFIYLLAGFLWPALWGAQLLHRGARKAVAEADARGLSGDARTTWIARRGGQSRRALVVTLITGILLLVIAGNAGQRAGTDSPAPAPPPDTLPPRAAAQTPPTRATSGNPPPPSVDELLQAARQDLAALRLSKPPGNNAMEKIEQALAAVPHNADALALRREVAGRYLQLAGAAFDKEDLDAAAHYLERAARIEPDLPQLDEYRHNLRAAQLVQRAQQAAEAGNLERAESQLRQAHELLPRNAEVETWLKKLRAQRKLLEARDAFRDGRTAEARKLVNEARRLYGNNKAFKRFEQKIKEWRKGR